MNEGFWCFEFGCAFVEVDPVTLKAVHWFAPTNWQTLDGQDADLGSGGVLLLPGTSMAEQAIIDV